MQKFPWPRDFGPISRLFRQLPESSKQRSFSRAIYWTWLPILVSSLLYLCIHWWLFTSAKLQRWPLLCSGPAVSPSCERRGFFSAGNQVNCHMWTIQGQQAQLQTSSISGTLDLGVPGSGLQQLCCSDQPLPIVGLLGVTLAQKLIDVSQINQHYARDNCLVASYGDAVTTSCHAQLQWRGIEPEPGLWMGGFELIVSFEAPLPTGLSEWKTTSEISGQIILAPGDDEALGAQERLRQQLVHGQHLAGGGAR